MSMILCSKTTMIYPVDDTITRARSQRTHKQCLCSAVETCTFGFKDGVVLEETESNANDNGDTDRNEKSVIGFLRSKVWDHREEATFAEVEIESVMDTSSGQEKRRNFDVPIKYEIPIVAADIHARETLGFSSFNSKSIINWTMVLMNMSPFSMIFLKTHPNPLLIIPSKALNHRLTCFSRDTIAVENLKTLLSFRTWLGENFFTLARFFTLVVVSIGNSC